MPRNRNSAKRAGARFEQAVAHYLSWALNDERIERRHLSGTKDRGDITGILFDGHRVVIECKDTSRMDIAQHLREAEEEPTTTTHYSTRSSKSAVGSASTGSPARDSSSSSCL